MSEMLIHELLMGGLEYLFKDGEKNWSKENFGIKEL